MKNGLFLNKGENVKTDTSVALERLFPLAISVLVFFHQISGCCSITQKPKCPWFHFRPDTHCPRDLASLARTCRFQGTSEEGKTTVKRMNVSGKREETVAGEVATRTRCPPPLLRPGPPSRAAAPAHPTPPAAAAGPRPRQSYR